MRLTEQCGACGSRKVIHDTCHWCGKGGETREPTAQDRDKAVWHSGPGSKGRRRLV